MRKIAVENAVGLVLAHDITQIIPGEYKGARFKKGHIIKDEDVPLLLQIGKRSVFALEKEETDVHEDDAAYLIASMAAGENIELTEPSEGKIELIASQAGLVKLDRPCIYELVDQDEVMFASIHENVLVKPGQKVAGTRIIPLFISEESLGKVKKVLEKGPLVSIRKLEKKNVGIVVTGSEVFSGKIEDAFGPVLIKKFQELGSEVRKLSISDDDPDMIAGKITELKDMGCEVICVTGGMSVDPDDVTPEGIRRAGGMVVSYGAPVLPGAMFMLAYLEDVPVVGLPGCVMYSKKSIFDIIVPRILAGERLSKKDINCLSIGGLCMSCEICTFPACGFGKG